MNRDHIGFFHPALASGFFGGIGTAAGMALWEMMRRREEQQQQAPSPQTSQVSGAHRGDGRGGPSANRQGAIMSMYDIVGSDFAGSVGYDALIGDDADELLNALAISGDDDDFEDLLVSGLGDSEIIGAVKKAQANKKLAAIKAVARKGMGAVVQRGLDRKRRYPLGFIPTSIPAATIAQIPSAPQNLYRPERLVIPSDIAFDSGVADIKVGNQSQLVQSVEVPGALFSEVAINTGVTFDTAEVGNQVSVSIRNKSGSSFEFSAGLVGTIAK